MTARPGMVNIPPDFCPLTEPVDIFVIGGGSAGRVLAFLFGVGTHRSPTELAADEELLESPSRQRVSREPGRCGLWDWIGVEGLRVCDASLMPIVPLREHQRSRNKDGREDCHHHHHRRLLTPATIIAILTPTPSGRKPP